MVKGGGWWVVGGGWRKFFPHSLDSKVLAQRQRLCQRRGVRVLVPYHPPDYLPVVYPTTSSSPF
jgi:hypothetical protein